MRDIAASRPRRIYYWIHHTGSYDGNTGVQRVVRMLAASLLRDPSIELIAVRWCAQTESIVRADEPFLSGFARYGGPTLPAPAEAGTALHLSEADSGVLDGSWLLLGEVPHLGGSTRGPGPMVPVVFDYARYHGMRIAALFYDLIPLRVGGYEAMASSHAVYAAGLMAADIVLPISRTAGGDLVAWWREQGHLDDHMPPLAPLLLPAEMLGTERVTEPDDQAARDGVVRFLSVGTVEPRKNQLAVAEALNRLARRRPDLGLRLDIAGHLHPAVAAPLRAQAAQSDGRIVLHQYLDDESVRALTASCNATVFVSRAEGFGLPIGESLWQGKPCLCSNLGSMAEIAEGGGCLAVDPNDADAIERGLERLAEDRALRASLAREACTRALPDWDAYRRQVLDEIATVGPLRLMAVLEGRRGGGGDIRASLEAHRVRVRPLHWRADTQTLLPGFADQPEPLLPVGGGDLRGIWGILPLASVVNLAEAMRIQDEAAGLGLRLAILVEPGREIGAGELDLLAGADLALFQNEAEREAALALALRTLPRPATLRSRWQVALCWADCLRQLHDHRLSRTASVGAPVRPRRIYFFVGLTASQPFNTGIQRVSRTIGRVLEEEGVTLVPLKWDDAAGHFAVLDKKERAVVGRWSGPLFDAVPERIDEDLKGQWLFVPEVSVPSRPPGSNIAAYAKSLGMRVAAIFYDLIPLKMAHIYPEGMLPAFEAYWRLFAEADMALPISWTVAAELRRYLAERGLRLPAIVVCPLGADLPGAARQRTALRVAPGQTVRLLAIGSWEVRKNYPRLLRALIEARRLAGTGQRIELTIVGRRVGLAALDAEIEQLAAQAGGVTLTEHVSDEALVALAARSNATVFGSWEEGFGLPVLESLWRGLPCLCHDGSAMAEVAPGGGTLAVDMLDEAAIAAAIARLATEPGLLDRLSAEAVARPLRTWRDYGRDVLQALSHGPQVRGWPLPAIISPGERPLLSCAVTTYNRAHWLTHTLPRLIEAARPFGSRVEVVVCDNTSTDNTPEIVARFAGTPNFNATRNPSNVGMLGNMGATTRASRGAYVWVIGDDDLITENGIGDVLEGLEAHSDVEMAYMNYAYTSFDRPEQLREVHELVQAAHPIGYGGPNRRVDALRDVAAFNENLFTSIYACAFRRDHALRAYHQDVSGPPFSSLLTCIPSSVYALAALQDRPAWWVGRPTLVVNLNVSWLRWVLLWHLERMPDLFDAAELAGIDPVRVDRHRVKHAWNAGDWVRMAFNDAEDPVRQGISIARLIERCKHLPVFQDQMGKLRAAYIEAWRSGRVVADDLPPEALFARYGLELEDLPR